MSRHKTKTRTLLSFLALAAMGLYSVLDGGLERLCPIELMAQPSLATAQLTGLEQQVLLQQPTYMPPISLHNIWTH
jgi:hypothetical protein